jgi:hypothetical protein
MLHVCGYVLSLERALLLIRPQTFGMTPENRSPERPTVLEGLAKGLSWQMRGEAQADIVAGPAALLVAQH